MKGTAYKLGNYKIIEIVDGTLWWESYAGFARTQSGTCFVKSKILFLGPAIEFSEPGFLIMEYNDALHKLPPWTRTPYYCTDFTLRFCHNDKVLPKVKIKAVADDVQLGEGSADNLGLGYLEDSVYRLGRYKIIQPKDGKLRWNTCSHMERLVAGNGFIDGRILFIDGKIIEESDCSKWEFYKQLKKLPEWRKTPYYCTSHILNCLQSRHDNESLSIRSFREGLKHSKNFINNAEKAHTKKPLATVAGIITSQLLLLLSALRTIPGRFYPERTTDVIRNKRPILSHLWGRLGQIVRFLKPTLKFYPVLRRHARAIWNNWQKRR